MRSEVGLVEGEQGAQQAEIFVTAEVECEEVAEHVIDSMLETSSGAGYDTPTTEPQAVAQDVDIQGCLLDVLGVKEGDTGPAVDCTQRALAVTGYYPKRVPEAIAAATAGTASVTRLGSTPTTWLLLKCGAPNS